MEPLPNINPRQPKGPHWGILEITEFTQSASNISSNEYFKAIDRNTLKSDVISAKFLNIKDGQAKSLMYYAKYARGLMARWIIINKIEFAKDLKEFDLDGYKYNNNLSKNNELVFTRSQPETKK